MPVICTTKIMAKLFSMKFRLLLLALLSTASLFAQKPVKWSFSTKDAGNCQVDLIFTASIEDGWYTYSQFVESDEGPLPTTFTYAEGPHFKLIGKAEEGGAKSKFMTRSSVST